MAQRSILVASRCELAARAAPRLAAAPLRPAVPGAPSLRRRRNVLAQYSVPAIIAERAAEAEEALPLPRAVESPADDPLLHNPLQRMERLGTGWFGVIADYEGVVVDSTLEVHKEAWRRVAAEMGYPAPLGSSLARIKGMRDDTVVMQLLNWTRNPSAAAAIAARKEELYDQIMSGNAPAEAPGVRAFLETLHNCKVPVALTSPLPERRIRAALDRLNLGRSFAAVVTAEDNASPDMEPSYLAASQIIQRPPLRCVVVGDSNRSVEAARELGMRSVVVTGGQPAWNFGGADLVVRNLGQLSFVNLKNLFGQEDLVEPSIPWEEIRQQEKEDYEAQLSAASSGGFAFGGFSRSGSSGAGSGVSSATVWDADIDLDGSLDGGLGRGFPSGAGASRGREPVLAGAGGAARQQQQYERQAEGGGGVASLEEDEDDFEVILPPKGAAFWDLQ